MKRFLFTLSFALITMIGKPQITFQKKYGGTGGDTGWSAEQTSDSGYVITGSTNSYGAGMSDVYLIKTDINGDTLWTKTYGGIYPESGADVGETSDGGYIIAGTAFGAGNGSGDIYLIKTNSSGDTLWTKILGSAVNDGSTSVQQTTDGGFIILGDTYSNSGNQRDIYLVKTDSIGNVLWSKTFGSLGEDYPGSVVQTSDGGYFITGTSQGFVISYKNVYVIKTDNVGSIVWSKVFGGQNDDNGNSGFETADGGYVIVGNTYSFGIGYKDVYLIKTDSAGNLLWSKTYGGNSDDEAYCVQQTIDGGYIISGYTMSFSSTSVDIYLIKADTSGSPLWTKTIHPAISNYAHFVQQTFDGGYIIAGAADSTGLNHSKIFLIKTDSSGNVVCNSLNPASIFTTPATLSGIPTPALSSPIPIESYYFTTVGSGGVVTTLCSNVGINEIIRPCLFSVSPNPNSGKFVLLFEQVIKKGNVEIINAMGKTVFNESIFNVSEKDIDLVTIRSGIYFIKVTDGEKYFCEKIIIQ